MSRGALWPLRVFVLVATLAFSAAVLGLSAQYIHNVQTFTVPPPPAEVIPSAGSLSFSTPVYVKLALATAIISTIGVIPLLVVGFVCGTSIAAWSVIEAGVLSLLSVLWIATSVTSLLQIRSFWTALHLFGLKGTDCSALGDLTYQIIQLYGDVVLEIIEDEAPNWLELPALCTRAKAIEGLSFTIWPVLVLYIFTVLICAAVSARRGNTAAWKTFFRDTNFFARADLDPEMSIPMTEKASQGEK